MPEARRRAAKVRPQLEVAPPPVRRAGPAELFAEVAPLLTEPRRGQDALARLAELLQEDPALIDLRFDEDAVLHALRAAPEGAPGEEICRKVLPALVPPRFGRELAEVFAAVAGRRADPADAQALALGRYLAILDDVEGAAGAGANPLWRILLELTWHEASASAAEGREILRVPPALQTA